jgi:hypothetical protein
LVLQPQEVGFDMTEDVFHRTLEGAVEEAIEAPFPEAKAASDPGQRPLTKIGAEGLRRSTLTLTPQHGSSEVQAQDPRDSGRTAR